MNKNQLFVVGRNLLQAAVGDSHRAQGFITNPDILSRYSDNRENHLLNGILFEIYFNKEGQFRYKNFKTFHLDALMKYVSNESLISSFEFINNVLKEFSYFLIFIPSPTPRTVAIDVKLSREEVNTFWDEKQEKPVIKTISFEGYELMADEEDSNVFPFHKEEEVQKEQLKQILCEGYAIPLSYLEIIYNMDPDEEYMWLNHKFKRNFRGK